MAVDQSGKLGGVPERFAPEEMRGQLLEAEHLSRYRWAARLAKGKQVLDAGCGTAYGTALLAEAGASSVLGVDLASTVLDSVRDEMPEGVELRVADLTQLDLPDDTFDLIVCFEVVEHFKEPFIVLDHLARVLAPGGVLIVSSPNRGVYPPGNPHHFHEFTSSELRASTEERFTNVRLMRQQTYVTAAVLADEQYESSDSEPLKDVPLYKLVEQEADTEMFTLAICSDGDLPPLPSLATMTAPLGIKDWVDTMETQEMALQRHRQYISELETQVAGRADLEGQLVAAEQRAGRVPGMELQVDGLEGDLRSVNRELEDARAELQRCSNELNAAKTSFSWRITRPLRDGKSRLFAWVPGRR
jgi:2-polyprenyl-3-methyl-5-hydroxy-6-metoxy-1,4-benzoquinol methylase